MLGLPGVLTLQVGHGDVGVDAIEGPAGLQAAVATWLIVELALITGVVVVTEDGWGRGEARVSGGSGDQQGLTQVWPAQICG